MAMLQQYPWPGNIREMRNVLERAAQIAECSPLTVRDLELQYAGGLTADFADKRPAIAMETTLTTRQLEARYIELVLSAEDGSIDRAAKRLGISRSSLYSKVKSRGVERAMP